jgi:dGTPase
VRFAKPRQLSVFAVHAAQSRGRLYAGDSPSPTRSEFQRDRDRIIHSAAFRRLKHKTQVFVEHEGDHYRTRLTHTIEVSQIARSLARILGLEEDLAEALALAHDLGHTPFGHAGEDALQACMRDFGGFDHNAQALRIVTTLERRYAAYDGLNLTWETLEGLVKHNGPLLTSDGQPTARYQASGVPRAILAYDALHALDLASHASAEAQAAAIADDIAYNAHDLDDGLRAGLFTLDDLKEVPFLAAILDEIAVQWPGLEASRAAHELMRRVITRFVEDVALESETRLIALNPQDSEAIRQAGAPVVAFSASMAGFERDLKTFLMARMYRHPRLMRLRANAMAILQDLFSAYMKNPQALPEAIQVPLDPEKSVRTIADHIAGMTDRFARAEHQRLFDASPSFD